MLLVSVRKQRSSPMQDRPALAERLLSVAPRESRRRAGRDAQALLLVESHALVGGPSPLLLAHAARARAGARTRPAPRAQSREDAVQPRRVARRHLPDRVRPYPRLLHRAIGTRDHAGLLEPRQLRRRAGNLRFRRASLVRCRSHKQQRGGKFWARRCARWSCKFRRLRSA